MKHYKIFTVVLCAFFITGCGSLGKSSRTPTDTLKALHEASKKKDVAGIKKVLSKGTLKLLENSALAANKTSDELLKMEDGAPVGELPEILGEKIEGDTAYVEIKNEITKKNEKIPLVKEDGEWKIALDIYQEDMKKQFDEEMNKMQNAEKPISNSNSETVKEPKNPANKQ